MELENNKKAPDTKTITDDLKKALSIKAPKKESFRPFKYNSLISFSKREPFNGGEINDTFIAVANAIKNGKKYDKKLETLVTLLQEKQNENGSDPIGELMQACASMDQSIADAEKARAFKFNEIKSIKTRDLSARTGEIYEFMRDHLSPNGRLIFSKNWSEGIKESDARTFQKAALEGFTAYRNQLLQRQYSLMMEMKPDEDDDEYDSFPEFDNFEDFKAKKLNPIKFPETEKLLKIFRGKDIENSKFEEQLRKAAGELASAEVRFDAQLMPSYKDVISGLTKKFEKLDAASKRLIIPNSAVKKQAPVINEADYIRSRGNILSGKILSILDIEDTDEEKEWKFRLNELKALSGGHFDSAEWTALMKEVSNAKFTDVTLNIALPTVRRLEKTEALTSAVNSFASYLAAGEFKALKAASGENVTEDKVVPKAGDLTLEAMDSAVYKGRNRFHAINDFYDRDMQISLSEKETAAFNQGLADHVAARKDEVKNLLGEILRPAIELNASGHTLSRIQSEYISDIMNGAGKLIDNIPLSRFQNKNELKELTSKIKELKKENLSELTGLIDSLAEALAGAEYYERYRTQEQIYDVTASVKNIFNEAASKKEAALTSEKYWRSDYDWSADREDRDAYVNDKKAGIITGLEQLLNIGYSTDDPQVKSYVREVFQKANFFTTNSNEILGGLNYAETEFNTLFDAAGFKETEGSIPYTKQENYTGALDALAEKLAEYEFREKKKGAVPESFTYTDFINKKAGLAVAEQTYLNNKANQKNEIYSMLSLSGSGTALVPLHTRKLRQLAETFTDTSAFLADKLLEITAKIEAGGYEERNGVQVLKRTDALDKAVDELADAFLMSDDDLKRKTGPDGILFNRSAPATSENCLKLVEELTQLKDSVDNLGLEVDKATENMAAIVRYYKLMVRCDGILNPDVEAGNGPLARDFLGDGDLPYLIPTLFEGVYSAKDLADIPVEELLSPEKLSSLHFNIALKAMAHEADPAKNDGLDSLNNLINSTLQDSRPALSNYAENRYFAAMIREILDSDGTLTEKTNAVNAVVDAAEALAKPEQYLERLNRIRRNYSASGNFFVSNQGLKDLHDLQNAFESYASEFEKLRKVNEPGRAEADKLIALKTDLVAEANRFKAAAEANGWIENPPKGLEKAMRFTDEILKLVGQDPSALPAALRQNALREPEAQDLPGADFQVLDYRRYVQEEAALTNNMMHYLQQKFHIDDNDLKLLLGKGAEGKNLTEQAEKVINDIIDRNMIPDDVIYESDVKSLSEGAVKEVRSQVAGNNYEAGRHTLARALMEVFPTSDFDPSRNYETQPFVNPEKSGIRAKSALYNYFVFLKRDEYDPDSWYKSGTLSDLVNKWAEKKGHAGITDAEIQSSVAKTLNKKWKFGMELSEMIAERMVQKFESIREEKGFAPGNNFKAVMYAAVSEHFPSSLDLLKEITRSLPEERLAAFDIRLPSDIHDKYLSGMNSYTIKTEYRPAAGAEKLEKLSAAAANAGTIGENLGKCAHLLKDTNEFDMLCQMFDTKKKYRLFNGSSSEYKQCQKALSDLRAMRNDILRVIAGLQNDPQNEGRLILSADDRAKLEPMLSGLAALQNTCAEKMTVYNNKVFIESIADKSQSAGMARFAGVQGLAEIIHTSDGHPLIEKADFRRNEQTAVQSKNIKTLFEEEYNKGIVRGKKDIHRRAASKAMEKQEVNRGSVLP